MSEHRNGSSLNVTNAITCRDRELIKGHMGFTIWFTGMSGSGKTTISTAAEKALHQRVCYTYTLDGDNISLGINKDLGFSPEDRKENIQRIGEIAELFSDSGVINLLFLISPYRSDRQVARELTRKDGTFIELFADCPLEVCEKSDPKGMYKKALQGINKEFTGVSAPYEKP